VKTRLLIAIALIASFVFAAAGGSASAKSLITQISSDPFSGNVDGDQHHTQVEPDIFSYNGTIVAGVQQGRRQVGGGSTDPGWATFNGKTWQHGSFPGLTKNSSPPGTYDRASDPSIAYDAKHGVWLASTLAIIGSTGRAVTINSSTDGITWQNATTAQLSNGDFYDKDWIVCDNTSSSPHYGNCYIEWDDASQGDQPYMSYSSDGGKTWSSPALAGSCCLGGQPVVQPNGTVIVPLESGSGIGAFRSTDGGKTWGSEVNVANVNYGFDPGNIRSGPLPSAQIDNTGKVYVVWGDCSFENGCSTNDIVMSTSTDGVNWSSVQRIPIDPVGSGVDHLLPGIGVDPATGGSSAHLALVYYYFPTTNCSVSTCRLDVGYVSSTNGGTSWSKATQVAKNMHMTWLANTDQGYMVGDYMAATVSGGTAYPAFVVAKGPKRGVFNEALYTAPLPVTGGSETAPRNEPRVGSAPHRIDPRNTTAL